MGDYCAWFSPDEKLFLDTRLPLFTGSAADYERFCQTLDPALPVPGGSAAPLGWPVTRQQYDVVCAVLYDPGRRRLDSSLRQLFEPTNRWELLRVEGQAALIGWKDADLSPMLRFAPERAVFAAKSPEDVPPAPGQGPGELNRAFPWWHPYLDRPGGTTWEADAAAIYVRVFEESSAQQLAQQHDQVIARHLAGIVFLSALSEGPAPMLARIVPRFDRQSVFLPDLLDRSAALPLLAVRAARRAVAAHLDDARAWLTLAEAYALLNETTAEVHSAALAPLAQLRQIQIVTALVQAVTVNPDLITVHEFLARAFEQMQFYDLA